MMAIPGRPAALATGKTDFYRDGTRQTVVSDADFPDFGSNRARPLGMGWYRVCEQI